MTKCKRCKELLIHGSKGWVHDVDGSEFCADGQVGYPDD